MVFFKSEIFPSTRRILVRSEFLRTWSCGKKIHTDFFIIVLMKKQNGPTRLGVTASKKVGGAVQRNKVKRMVREFFRKNYVNIDSQLDISIIAKKGAAKLNYDEIYENLAKLLID